MPSRMRKSLLTFSLGSISIVLVLASQGVAAAFECPEGATCTSFETSTPPEGATIIGPMPAAPEVQRPAMTLDNIDWSRITAADIETYRSMFSPEQIAAIAPSMVGKLTSEQLAAFGPQVMGYLSSDQIAEIAPQALGVLSSAQIMAIAPAAVARLSAAQIEALQDRKSVV